VTYTFKTAVAPAAAAADVSITVITILNPASTLYAPP
jgi:hypothetical protein